MNLIECRDCHGTGEIRESASWFGDDCREFVCPRCNGEGEHDGRRGKQPMPAGWRG